MLLHVAGPRLASSIQFCFKRCATPGAGGNSHLTAADTATSRVSTCRQGTGSPQQLADLRTVSRSFRRAASRAVCLKLAPASLRESEVRMLAAFPSVRHLDLSNVPDGVRRRPCCLRICFMPAFAVCRSGRSLGLAGGITTVTQMLLVSVSVEN